MGEPAVNLIEMAKPELKKNSAVCRLLTGNFVSFFGDQMYLLVLPIIVFHLSGSSLSMGIVVALERVAVLLQPLTGTIADQFDRRKLILISDLSRSAIMAVMGYLFIIGGLQTWHLYLGALLLGLFSQLYNASQFSTIPLLVRRQDLHFVNSIDTGLFNTAIFIGPGLGGILISLYEPGIALLINSVSFFATFTAMLTIKVPYPKKPMTSTYIQTFIKDLKGGFAFVCKTKPILYTNFSLMVSSFGTTMFIALMLFHFQDEMNFSAGKIGLILSIGGLGAIGGSLVTGYVKRFVSFKNILRFSHLIGGLSIIFLALSEGIIGATVYNAIGVIAVSAINPCIVTIRQTFTPVELLGRVQSTSRFMTWSLMPISALLAGIISEHIGTGHTIIIAGLITCFATLVYSIPALKKINF